MQMKLLGITNVDFDVMGQRLIRSSIAVYRVQGNLRFREVGSIVQYSH
jgi:hypothetical protein